MHPYANSNKFDKLLEEAFHMNELIKRLIITMTMAFCIFLLFVSAKTNAVIQEDWLWPAEGILTDTFGTRGGTHYGIDIAAEEGTPVYAANDGIVVKSYYSHSYGNVIFIQHENEMETVYAHLHKRLVSEGVEVEKGEMIGEVGNTGRSSGSHLHFELHDGPWDIHKSSAINPLLVLGEQNQKEDHQLVNENIEEPKAQDASRYDYIKRNVITVEEGDTLWGFSEEFDVTVEEIMTWNNLDSSLIFVDQQLIIHQFNKM